MKNDKYSSEKSIEQLIHEFNQMNEEKQNEIIMNPGHVDEGIWDKAKEASKKSVGEIKWPLVMYLYKKMGGK